MKVLVIGGAGKVGRIIVPALGGDHEVIVADIVGSDQPVQQHVPFDITDPAAWEAMPPADALIFLAMPTTADPDDLSVSARQFDISVRGLYLALNWAGRRGASRVIYASSLSVFATPPGDRYPSGPTPPDAFRAYGLAKRLGEEVCRAAVREWGVTVTALRLAHPSTTEEWSGPVYPTATSPGDVAAAFLAALERDGGDFLVVPVSGDRTGEYVDISETASAIGWTPCDRLTAVRPWPVVAR